MGERSPSPPAHRRSGTRSRRSFVVVGLVALGITAGAALIAPSLLRRGARVIALDDAPQPGTDVHSTGPGSLAAAGGGTEEGWPVFATAAGLDLVLPNPGVEAVAYHQASYGDAIRLTPVGELLKNYAGKLFDAEEDSPGPRYIVQPQRTGRRTAPTSAVDLVLPKKMDVYSPVTGTVVVAKRYKLYGRYPDVRVEIRPTDHPEVRVVVIHLTDVHVRDGDEVSATLSPIGTARVFPFHSVVNDYVGGGDPHVHLEVKQEDAA